LCLVCDYSNSGNRLYAFGDTVADYECRQCVFGAEVKNFGSDCECENQNGCFPPDAEEEENEEEH